MSIKGIVADVRRLLQQKETKTALALFVVALVLYLPGLGWGLPHATAADRIHPWGPDEIAPLGFGELYFVFFSPDPRFDPRYPLLYYIIQATAIGPYVVWLGLTGQLAGFSAEFPHGLLNPAAHLAIFTVLGRLPSTLMAAGLVVIAFKTATRLWHYRAGLLAGLATLVMYPQFYYSRTSNVDMAALFFTALGLAVFAVIVRTGLTVGRAAWLGTFAALATAVKDPSYAVFVSLVPVIVYYHLRDQDLLPLGRKQLWLAPLAGILTGAVIYLFFSGLVFSPARYFRHIEFILAGSPEGDIMQWYYTTPGTMAGYAALTARVVEFAAAALGIPLLILAVVGLSWCAARDRGALALALPAVGILAGVIFPVRFVEFRFVLVIDYVLAIFGGYTLAMFWQRRHFRRYRMVPALLVAVALGWPLVAGLDLTYAMLNDSRYTLAAWFEANAAHGDRIANSDIDGAWRLPPVAHGLVTEPFDGFDPTAAALVQSPPEFVVMVPMFRGEELHENYLTPEVYRQFTDGSLGYEQVFFYQTPTLFKAHPITYVNPPVTVFVRRDRLQTIKPLEVNSAGVP